MKVVINTCYGGFSINDEAFELYLKKKKIKFYKYDSKYSLIMGADYYRVPREKYEAEKEKSLTKYGNYKGINSKNWYLSAREIERNDPTLIEVIEELGEKANTRYSELKIVEIPDGIKFEIDEYDGIESIHENHRSWS